MNEESVLNEKGDSAFNKKANAFADGMIDEVRSNKKTSLIIISNDGEVTKAIIAGTPSALQVSFTSALSASRKLLDLVSEAMIDTVFGRG